MTLPDLIDALDSRGVNLGLRLVVDAPSGALDSDVRAGLAEHRSALLAKLAREAQWVELKDQTWAKDDEGEPEDLGCVADGSDAEAAHLKASRTALQFLVGMTANGRTISRERAVSHAVEYGISVDGICEAAHQLGVEKTIEGDQEIWRLP